MNLKPDEIHALISHLARKLAEGKDDFSRDDGRRMPLSKSQMTEMLERMLQLTRELP